MSSLGEMQWLVGGCQGGEVDWKQSEVFLLGTPRTLTKERCLLHHGLGTNITGNISSARSGCHQVLPHMLQQVCTAFSCFTEGSMLKETREGRAGKHPQDPG